MKNLLLGAFTGYDYSKIQYWINSFKATGSNADVVVVVGNASKETVEKLGQKGCQIIAFGNTPNGDFTYHTQLPMQTERFFHYWNFLKDRINEYDLVIHTDMKDVIFQTDPFKFLHKGFFHPSMYTNIIASTECIKYENEPWGKQNLIDTFGPYLYEQWKNWEIFNVGVIGGKSSYMKDLFLDIFLGSVNRPVAICEQAVYNKLIHTKPWNLFTFHAIMDEGFCANLGTVMDPDKIDKFRPHLLEPEPLCDQEHVITKGNDIISIVHQYDRVPELKEYFEKKFCDEAL